MSATPQPRFWATLGVFSLLILLVLIQSAHASYLTKSGFPWEGCKWGASYNRWTLSLVSYKENAAMYSRACFRFGYKDVNDCTPSGLRCCGENRVNKFKMYVDPVCQCNDIFNITVNDRTTTACFRDNLHGNASMPTLKITDMNIPFEQLNTTTLCFSLRNNCSTLSALANPYTRAQGLLEVGLYDVKSNNYECCPMFVFPIDGGITQKER